MIFEIRREILGCELQNYDKSKTRFVFIGPDLTDKHSLLKIISDELGFPDYFGFNWDALDECLRDLHWLTENYVVFVINEKNRILSKEPIGQKNVFFSCLNDASDFWDNINDALESRALLSDLVFDVYYVED